MSKRNTGVVFALAGAVTLFFSFLVFGLRAHASGLEMGEAQSQEDHEIPEGKEGYPILGFQAFWKDGIHLQGPWEKIKVQIRGSAKLDAGRLDGDDQIGRAFTDFIGQDAILRSLRLNLLTTFYDTVEWKLEFDFANPAQIKENWLGLTSEIPYLGFLRAGYMKEPFSLEILTSSTDLVFMEASLPVWTFAPGSNLGVRAQNSAWEGRVNWAAGGFWNVQPTDRLGDASDRIDQSNGFDLTFRLYGLPWYEGEGGKLLHLGVGYNHRFVSNGELRYKTRPETYLTDNALVDTKEFSIDRTDLFNLEAAAVFGFLSYQGEVFYSLPAGGAGGTHHFWGGVCIGQHLPDRRTSSLQAIRGSVFPDRTEA